MAPVSSERSCRTEGGIGEGEEAGVWGTSLGLGYGFGLDGVDGRIRDRSAVDDTAAAASPVRRSIRVGGDDAKGSLRNKQRLGSRRSVSTGLQ